MDVKTTFHVTFKRRQNVKTTFHERLNDVKTLKRRCSDVVCRLSNETSEVFVDLMQCNCRLLHLMQSRRPCTALGKKDCTAPPQDLEVQPELEEGQQHYYL